MHIDTTLIVKEGIFERGEIKNLTIATLIMHMSVHMPTVNKCSQKIQAKLIFP